MATKLGEMLVAAGRLTLSQLNEALKSQVIFGGRLGTNLIEMGYLGEDDLAAFLSKKMALPCVTSAQMASIPGETISLVPKTLAEKYHIVPLSLEKKRLTLAMLDPTDLALMDEISFVTGYVIVPMIAPEVLLVLAMERYYGIKPDMRFVQLAEKNRAREARKAPPTEGRKADAPPPAVAPPEEAKEVIIDAFEEVYPAPEAAKPEPARIEPAMAKVVAGDSFLVEPIAVDQFRMDDADIQPAAEPIPEPALEPVAKPEARPAEVPPPEPAPVADKESIPTADTLAERLSEARDREEIADLLVSHFSGEFDRVVLFMIKGNVAVRWRGERKGKPLPAAPEAGISLEAPSVLKTVTEGKSYFLGGIPETTENGGVLDAIGEDPPSSALLVPLMLMGRVVAVLCVDGGDVPPADRLAELQKLVGKASMAFEILILKNKILMT